jgi:hypothetical protein
VAEERIAGLRRCDVTLIKIGDRYINLDNVTNIGPLNEEFAGKPGVMQIEYVGRTSEDWGAEWVEGNEADALRWWLKGHSRDICYERANPL